MANRTCTITGCGRPLRARGWCATHYSRWRRNGTIEDIYPTLTERFWAKVDGRGEGVCWSWTAALASGGYGLFTVHERMVLSHRFAYELLVGPIPDGLHIDHLCRNRRCVNPDHLEPVTCRENVLRGVSNSARNARKTHCPQGHPYDDENTYITPVGGRNCRACKRARNKSQPSRRFTT